MVKIYNLSYVDMGSRKVTLIDTINSLQDARLYACSYIDPSRITEDIVEIWDRDMNELAG